MSSVKPAGLILATWCCIFSPSVQALYFPGPAAVAVTDTTTLDSSAIWTYSYSLRNNTTCFLSCSDTVNGKSISGYVLAVREFAVPYFADAQISSIFSPAGWAYTISTGDRFNLGNTAGALIWFATSDLSGIALDASLGGFGYQTLYGPGKGPFSATLGNLSSFHGDPAIPLSPNAIAAGIAPVSSVPEPESYLLVLLSLVAVASLGRRRETVS